MILFSLGLFSCSNGGLYIHKLSALYLSTVEHGYNEIGSCDTSSIALHILWYQLIAHYQPWHYIPRL
jgi:hypothetical protein